MKHTKITLALSALALLAAGCDNIDENDRYIKTEKPVFDNPRTLLIMEFTGNNCSNCPTGAQTVELISEGNPGQVITVGLHPEGTTYTIKMVNLNTTPPSLQDFTSPIATAMMKYYDPAGFPSAVFNGTKESLNGSIPAWQTSAKNALETQSAMTLAATCDFDSESGKLTVDYDINFTNTVTDDINISVWVMENDILGTQVMPNGTTNYQYVHNHVLRTSLTGDWGIELSGNPFYVEQNISGKATADNFDKDKWNPENCQAVVFVSRRSDHEVLQATLADVVPKL